MPEFKDEGNNTVVVPIDVTLAPAADLRVTSVIVPEHVLRGQMLSVTYTVTNVGGAAIPTPTATACCGRDLLYLSADPLLDTAADRFLGEVPHTGGRRRERRQLFGERASSGCRATWSARTTSSS